MQPLQDFVIPSTFVLLIPLAAFVHFKNSREKEDPNKQPLNRRNEFIQFQQNYVFVFLALMMADWMQGAHVYGIYADYGFKKDTIGMLFVSGYVATAICGPLIGAIADTYGRKKVCIFYCFAYSITCASMHFNNLTILFIGRIFGGISTAILFSCLESWMITEHYVKGFSSSDLSDTFSVSWRLNGIVAVLSGVLTGAVTSFVRTPVAAFDFSIVALGLGAAVIACTWQENFGEQMEEDCRNKLVKTFTGCIVAMSRDPRILIVGAIQSLFESAMYVFVFMWTSALDTVIDDKLNYGYIFACFMLSCMVGTQFSCILTEHWSLESCFDCLLIVAIISMIISASAHNFVIRFLMFNLFEFSVGAYWHAIGMQRAKYIPDNIRTTVMNIYQIPLNLIVVICLLNASRLSIETAFWICGILHSIAFIMQQVLGFVEIPPRTPKPPSLVGREQERICFVQGC